MREFQSSWRTRNYFPTPLLMIGTAIVDQVFKFYATPFRNVKRRLTPLPSRSSTPFLSLNLLKRDKISFLDYIGIPMNLLKEASLLKNSSVSNSLPLTHVLKEKILRKNQIFIICILHYYINISKFKFRIKHVKLRLSKKKAFSLRKKNN